MREAPQRPADDLRHGLARVERGIGVLEHDLRSAAHARQRALRQAGHVLAGDADAASVGLLQAQDQAAERRLAGPRLADQADHLACCNRQRHVVDRANARRPVARAPTLEGERREAARQRERLGKAAAVDDRACRIAAMPGGAR